MTIRTAVLSLLLLLVGCASQSTPVPEFFAGQKDFPATREQERHTFSSIDYDTLFAHVTESLLDLDCTLQETNKELGVISARGGVRTYPNGLNREPLTWRGCAGHRVTVTVVERAADEVEVRASFSPPDPRADQTFKLLLNKSIALAARE